MKSKLKSVESGQSLFEVVIALAISALIVMALVSLVSNSIQNANFSKNKTLASNYAQEVTEWLRRERDTDITTFGTNVLTPTWCFQSLSWNKPFPCEEEDTIAGTPFLRQASFLINTIAGKTIIEASIIVSWVDSQGVHEARSATNFSDWRQR